MLRFRNGDTLHGQYQGLDEGPLVQWLSSEAAENIAFETRNLQKLSLNGGRAQSPVTSQGVVNLVCGDVLPAEILSMGSDSITIQTQYSGLLTLARDQVLSLQPNRNGGSVLYAGPFSEDRWHLLPPRGAVSPAPKENNQSDALPPLEGAEPAPAKEDEKAWHYSGAAWYSTASQPIYLETPLSSKVSIRFHMAWKSRLNVDFGLLTDFMIPQDEPEEGEKVDEAEEQEQPEAPVQQENPKGEGVQKARVRRIPDADKPVAGDIRKIGTGISDSEKYGSGYMLSLQSTYARLQRLSFTEENKPKKTSFRTANANSQLQNLYEADFEIRLDRESGHISLLVNGSFYGEWQDPDTAFDDVPRYLSIEAQQQSLVRISDIAIAEWNGMPDSARSMQSNDRDILLLTNGTDRISGEILSLEEDVFQVKTDYATFQIPSNEVADIQLASDGHGETSKAENGQVAVSLQPHGRLTLVPHEGTADLLRGTHPVLGDLDLNLNFCYLVEFDSNATIFDNWDDDF